MPRVLIVYGTSEGHTRAIARAIAEPLSRSADVDVMRPDVVEPVLGHYDAIIVTASVHAGRYQKAVERWVRAHAAEFGARPTAFVSVSLAVRQHGDARVRADLDAIVTRFLEATGWQPGVVKHVAGALLYTRYNIFKRWIMKRIVAGAGGETDTSHDYDYTDWADVRVFAEEFRGRLKTAA